MNAPESGWLEGGWRSQHLDGCRLGRPEGLDLILLGDSLVQGWGGPGRRVVAPGAIHWERVFGRRRAGNLGVAGDRVRHVAWRVAHGALDGLAPARVLLLAGTNDLADGVSAEEVAARLLDLGREILDRLPRARLLLHGLLPRGAAPDAPLRTAVAATNALLATRVAALGPRASFADPGRALLADDGTLRLGAFADDALHLTADGYATWGAALEKFLPNPPPAFADGVARAPQPAWVEAERTAGLLLCGALDAGAAGAIGVCGALRVLEGTWLWAAVSVWALLAPVLLWIAWAWPRWEYPRIGYRLLPDRVEAWRGLWWRRWWSVPCARVQFTDVGQGPLQRKHGIATLQVHTAGVASSEVEVPGLPLALALQIRDWLVDRSDDDAV